MNELTIALMVTTLVLFLTLVLLGVFATVGDQFEEWRQMRIQARQRAAKMQWLRMFDERQRGDRS